MKRRIAAALLAIGLVVSGCAMMPGDDAGWITLVDGTSGLDNFNRIGDANWRAEDGAIVADKATVTSHLVSKNSYTNFQIRAEFWADHTTNSGIFIRIQDPKKVTDTSSYEVNIYDMRPGQEYATGGIVNFGRIPVPSKYKAGGKWNTFEITAKDTHLRVVFNGTETLTMYDSSFASGPFSLQFGNRGKEPGGAIKWRKVQIRPL